MFGRRPPSKSSSPSAGVSEGSTSTSSTSGSGASVPSSLSEHPLPTPLKLGKVKEEAIEKLKKHLDIKEPHADRGIGSNPAAVGPSAGSGSSSSHAPTSGPSSADDKLHHYATEAE
jgi:hypothetical protein